jgi:hypothetical protein
LTLHVLLSATRKQTSSRPEQRTVHRPMRSGEIPVFRPCTCCCFCLRF